MGKFLFLAVIGLIAYYVLWRGSNVRKREIAEEEKRNSTVETLVYDAKKDAYVPKKTKR